MGEQYCILQWLAYSFFFLLFPEKDLVVFQKSRMRIFQPSLFLWNSTIPIWWRFYDDLFWTPAVLVTTFVTSNREDALDDSGWSSSGGEPTRSGMGELEGEKFISVIFFLSCTVSRSFRSRSPPLFISTKKSFLNQRTDSFLLLWLHIHMFHVPWYPCITMSTAVISM